MRHLLSIEDLDPSELERLVERSNAFASGSVQTRRILDGKVVGIYFRRTSTRTRSAFYTGALRLGALVYPMGPNDLQLATGETIGDTTRVLCGYLDGLVIRTNDPVAEMRELASQDEMAIINALSAESHPTQALADLSTMREHFGRLSGLHVLYLGEGNSTAHALLMSVARTPGMRISFFTPANFGLSGAALEEARPFARAAGSHFEQHHSLERLPSKVDVVYTSRWQTMGVVKGGDPNWRDHFLPFAVTRALMQRVSHPGTIFLHDLPAVRGEDVESEVLDGAQSRAWRQARHKMFSAMAVMEWCIADA